MVRNLSFRSFRQVIEESVYWIPKNRHVWTAWSLFGQGLNKQFISGLEHCWWTWKLSTLLLLLLLLFLIFSLPQLTIPLVLRQGPPPHVHVPEKLMFFRTFARTTSVKDSANLNKHGNWSDPWCTTQGPKFWTSRAGCYQNAFNKIIQPNVSFWYIAARPISKWHGQKWQRAVDNQVKAGTATNEFHSYLGLSNHRDRIVCSFIDWFDHGIVHQATHIQMYIPLKTWVI